MRTEQNKPQKITIQIWRPIWSKLEKKIRASCLRRDAFIEQLAAREMDNLDAEVAIPNSIEARRFIEQQLRALHDFTPLSVAFSPATAKKLDHICQNKRIVRDAFFNRIFFFLAFGPKLAGMLLFDWDGEKPTAWTTEVWSECKHDGPFFDNVFEPFEALSDPLWPIHRNFELIEVQSPPNLVERTLPETNQKVAMTKVWSDTDLFELPIRFYTVILRDNQILKSTRGSQERGGQPNREGKRECHNLFGLNCYLPNHYIPGHKDAKALQKYTDDMLESL